MKIYGASDDLLQFRGRITRVAVPADEEDYEEPGLVDEDGYTVWDGPSDSEEIPLGLLSGERDVGGWFVLEASDGTRLRLSPAWDGCWSFAVRQYAKGEPLPPIRIVAGATNGEMPDGGLYPDTEWAQRKQCSTSMVIIDLPDVEWSIKWFRAPEPGLVPVHLNDSDNAPDVVWRPAGP